MWLLNGQLIVPCGYEEQLTFLSYTASAAVCLEIVCRSKLFAAAVPALEVDVVEANAVTKCSASINPCQFVALAR